MGVLHAPQAVGEQDPEPLEDWVGLLVLQGGAGDRLGTVWLVPEGDQG